MKTPSSDTIESWFSEKDFTADWTSHHFRRWSHFLDRFRDEPIEILEVGSFEGRSAVFFLEFMPKARITCADIFAGEYEARFDRNVAPYLKRLTKIKGRSVATLEALHVRKKKFNLIYIDGDHSRHGTFANSIGSWPLLETGGVLMWDDYKWHPDWPSVDRPQHAIDLFCSAFAGCYEELHCGYQVLIEKTAEWP